LKRFATELSGGVGERDSRLWEPGDKLVRGELDHGVIGFVGDPQVARSVEGDVFRLIEAAGCRRER
jgi:hypothetical protein